MSKQDGVQGNPNIKVTSTQSKSEALNTHGGTQRSEAHYKDIVDRSVNETPSNTRRK
jgi:hypothetical protein